MYLLTNKKSLKKQNFIRRITMEKIYFEEKDSTVVQMAPGLSRQVLAHGGTLMIAKIKINKGVIGPLHQHAHEQTTYILKGKIEFTIEDKKTICQAGDSLYIAPNLMHGVTCLEEGELLDIFTPMRDDFLS